MGSNLPLEDVVVVDFSQITSGPYCSQTLADWGARVIRVESPKGDELRSAGPPFDHGEGSYFLAVNRNKESIAVDLHTAEGQEIAHRLCAMADIVLMNYTPGVSTRLGIDENTIRTFNPNLIYVSITAFGETGPYRNRPGLDLVFQGMSGMMSLAGPVEGPPMRSPVAIVDMSTALYAAFAILLALRARDHGEGGQRIDLSMLDVGIAVQTMLFSYFFASENHNLPRRGNQSYTTLTDTFATADGFINVSIATQRHWESLCQVVDLADLLQDEKLETAQGRLVHQNVIHERMASRFKQKPAKEWLEVLTNVHIPCGPIFSYEEVVRDPQVLQDNIWLDLEHPSGGRVRTVAFPARFQHWQQRTSNAPPPFGYNTRRVLAEVGYSAEAIDELIQRGIVYEEQI